MRVFLIIFVVIGLAFQANAALPNFVEQNANNTGNNMSDDYEKANCPPSNARLWMEFNDVRALLEVGGLIWENRQIGQAAYEVPRNSNEYLLFAGSIWMGGVDANNQLKLAAVRFRQVGNDFWAGPLSQTVGSGDYDPSQPVGDHAKRDFGAATIDPSVCVEYDKFFTISKSEVINFTLAFECDQNPECDEDFPLSGEAIKRIYDWPAHGDVSKGQDYYLAPFYDYPTEEGGTGNGIYNPDEGDIPWFDDILDRDDVECGVDRRVTLFGDQTNWWVFNDKGNIHTESGADPIGMEIHAQAFSFATNDEVNRMTFYNYEMINRSTQTLYNTYFTQYVDPDLGDPNNDYVGCDVSRGLGYAYNADNSDAGYQGTKGWSSQPPAIGVDFFEGPYQDADGRDNVGPHWVNEGTDSASYYVPTVDEALADDGIVYEGIGIGYSDGIIDNERYGMRVFSYYNNEGGPQGDPSVAGDYHNNMTGKWKDNTPYFFGGDAYTSSGVTAVETKYVFPGSSDPYHFGTGGIDMGWDWSERNTDGGGTANDKGDRRFLQSAGPFTLEPGAVNNLTVGVVYGRAISGDAAASIEVLKKNDTKAQALFDACFEIMDPPNAPQLEIVELENKLVLLIDNPYGNNVNETYYEEDNINIPDPVDGSIIDKFYRFEGYQIYQMVDRDAGVSDIENNNRARLVAQCDVKNDISRIINFEFNEDLGFSIPTEKVDGENRGIRHSFELKEDAFSGERLVNHKTYYYIAIAYAHNEYSPYDPDDASKLDGQKIPYISSRLSIDGQGIKSVAGIPHSPKPSKNGTIANLPYGSSPEITTLDGTGNGNYAIDLTQKSEDYIVEHTEMDTPTYQKGKAPIGVKVIDPLNVVDGYFRLSFVENENVSNMDSVSWMIERYDQEGGELLEAVTSEQTISFQNEQLIPDWGISVEIYLDKYPCANSSLINCPDREKIAKPIESTLTFADSSLRWLDGVQHTEGYQPFNWIMSGNDNPNEEECSDDLGFYNPCCYKDLIGMDPDKEFTKVLDGTITLGQFARRNTCGFSPVGIPNSAGMTESTWNGMYKTEMTSILQPSIDIVFTNDKSKWTRVPVIELGVDPDLNIGGAKPGLLRKSPSVDKNGNMVGSPECDLSEANPDGSTPTGMGWFPGYAIDVESGRRLNMAFGENSFLGGENATDMVWNPTPRMERNGLPVMGGQHVVYVFGKRKDGTQTVPNYDKGKYVYEQLNAETGAGYKNVYKDLSWVYNPLTIEGRDVLATDARIRIRINKEYEVMNKTGVNNGLPAYEWNMDGDSRTINDDHETLADALDMINVVPNPYYAFSQYERGRFDTKVKITNLPDRCKVKIFNTSGKLIRAFDKDSPVTSIDWDLKNGQNIPVASGVYLIHVEVPEINATRVLKFFGGMRQVDLENL